MSVYVLHKSDGFFSLFFQKCY